MKQTSFFQGTVVRLVVCTSHSAAAAPCDRAAGIVLREVGAMYQQGELAALLGEAATRCPALLPLLPAVTRVLDALANGGAEA